VDALGVDETKSLRKQRSAKTLAPKASTTSISFPTREAFTTSTSRSRFRAGTVPRRSATMQNDPKFVQDGKITPKA